MMGAKLSSAHPAGMERSDHRLELAVAAAAACWWAVALGVLHAGTPGPLDDSWEYALTARSLLAGEGFRTIMIHPPLWSLRDASLTVPMLVHGPLLPVLLVPLLTLLGPAVMGAVSWLAAAFVVAAAVLTARVAARAWGHGAGILAALLVAVSPIMLRMVHHDVAPAAGAFAAAWTIDLVTRPRPRPFAAGLVLGIGALVRPEFLFALPVAALAIGASAWPALIAGYVIVAAPWAVYAMAATGLPFFNLSSYLAIAYTKAHPGLSPLTDFSLSPSHWWGMLAGSLPSLPAKWAHMAPRALRHMLMAPAPLLGWLAVVGAWAALRQTVTRRRAMLALLVAAIPFVLVTMTESSERYVAVFLPLWALGVVHGVEALRERLAPRMRAAGAWAAVAVVLLASAIPVLGVEATQARALRAWIAGEQDGLAQRVTPTLALRPMFSDTPDFVAWQTGRPTIFLEPDEYERLPASAASTADRPPRGRPDDEWFHANLRAGPAPSAGGPVSAALGTASLDR